MSDGGTGEKTEEPTPERLRKLRKDGNVSKSQDITMAASFLVVFVVLAGSMGFMADKLSELFDGSLAAMELVEEEEDATMVTWQILVQGLMAMMLTCAPAFAAAFVIGIAGNIAQVGFMFTMKPITPDIKRLNPIQGFKNLLNMKKVVETIKTVIKFTLVAYLSYAALRDALREVVLIIRVGL